MCHQHLRIGVRGAMTGYGIWPDAEIVKAVIIAIEVKHEDALLQHSKDQTRREAN